MRAKCVSVEEDIMCSYSVLAHFLFHSQMDFSAACEKREKKKWDERGREGGKRFVSVRERGKKLVNKWEREKERENVRRRERERKGEKREGERPSVSVRERGKNRKKRVISEKYCEREGKKGNKGLQQRELEREEDKKKELCNFTFTKLFSEEILDSVKNNRKRTFIRWPKLREK